jgi:hypothetical protein
MINRLGKLGRLCTKRAEEESNSAFEDILFVIMPRLCDYEAS